MKTYDQEWDEHYRKIRTDPEYRLQERLADMEAWSLPAMSSYEAQQPPNAKSDRVIGQSGITPVPSALDALKGDINNLMKRINQHIDKPKRKRREAEPF